MAENFQNNTFPNFKPPNPPNQQTQFKPIQPRKKSKLLVLILIIAIITVAAIIAFLLIPRSSPSSDSNFSSTPSSSTGATEGEGPDLTVSEVGVRIEQFDGDDFIFISVKIKNIGSEAITSSFTNQLILGNKRSIWEEKRTVTPGEEILTRSGRDAFSYAGEEQVTIELDINKTTNDMNQENNIHIEEI